MVPKDDLCLWHRRLYYFNIDLLNELVRKELVRGIPRLNLKMTRFVMHANLANKLRLLLNQGIVFLPLELLHSHFFGLTQVVSLGGEKYIFVIVDDYFRYIWVFVSCSQK